MTVASRLHQHYDSKYAESTSQSLEPIRLVRNPSDRFEMALKLGLRYAGGRYLEIGAGSGRVLSSLIDAYDELAATELSAVRVRELRNRFAGQSKVRILEHNIEETELPFCENYFDTVLMIAVIEHVFDPTAVLQKLRRVLKPGGVLIVDTPNIAKWTRRLKLLTGYFPSTASLDEGFLHYDGKTQTDLHDEGHLHYFTFRSLRRLAVERAHFSKAEHFGYGASPLSRWWPQMLSEVCFALYK